MTFSENAGGHVEGLRLRADERPGVQVPAPPVGTVVDRRERAPGRYGGCVHPHCVAQSATHSG